MAATDKPKKDVKSRSGKQTKEKQKMETIKNQSTDLPEMPKFEIYSSAKVVKEATDRIVQLSQDAARSFIGIGKELSCLAKNPKVLSDCGYVDVFDYGQKVFGFKTTSCRNMIGVFERFGDKGGDIQCKYEDYSFTQLVELLPVEDVNEYEPEMTVREIRDKKVLDKAVQERSGLSDYLRSSIVRMMEGAGLTGAKADPVKDIPSWMHSDYCFEASALDGREKVKVTVDFSLPSSLSFSNMYYGDSYRYAVNCRALKSFAELQKAFAGEISDCRKELSGKDAGGGEDPKYEPDEYESPVDDIDEIRKWAAMSDDEQKAALSLDALAIGYCRDGDETSLPFFLTDAYCLYIDSRGVGVATSAEGDGSFPVSLVVAGIEGAGYFASVTDVIWLEKEGGHLSPVNEDYALRLILEWCKGQIAIDDEARARWEKENPVL